MSHSDESNNSENPYAAPLSSSAIEHAAEDQHPQTQDLRAFVGPRADYYLGKWAPLLEGGGSGAGANWAAFFLSGLWIPYRTMYKVAAVFYGVILLESLAEEVLFVGVLGQSEAPAVVSRLAGLAVGWNLFDKRCVCPWISRCPGKDP